MINFFTIIAISAIVGTLTIRLSLALRHIAHVKVHRHSVPKTFHDTIPLHDHQRAADYTVARTRLSMATVIVDSVLVLAFTLGGGLAYVSDTLEPLLANDVLHGIALMVTVTIISLLTSIPLSLISTFMIESHFGFNSTTLRLFVTDLVKSVVLVAVFGIPLMALLLWLIPVSGEYWWCYTWLIWIGFSLFMLVLYPSVIAPLFNHFSPLTNTELISRIKALLDRTGFKSQGVFVMDGSTRSQHGNAYFTGFGQTKRIVFYDTLLKELSSAEIEAVLAHELGHFKLKHNRQRMVFTFVLALGCLFALDQLINTGWFYQGLGVSTPNNAIGLTLFYLIMPAFSFPLMPLVSLLGRHHEYEADAFAARETRADDLVNALIKLYRNNASTLTPDPWYSVFYYSHPPAPLRIAHLTGKTS